MTSEYVGAPYTPGSDTAQAAAEAIVDHVPIVRVRVLAALRDAGEEGLADHELQALIGGVWSTARTRRKELERDGLVYDSGLRRKTPSGRAAVVWVASPSKLQEAYA